MVFSLLILNCEQIYFIAKNVYKITNEMANRVDPDQTPHSVAFDLHLYGLLGTSVHIEVLR